MDNQARLVKTIDPRLNLTAPKIYTTSQGASYISERTWRPNGTTIGTATNFSCNPPNRNIVVSRQVMKVVDFKVTITGTSQQDVPQDIFAPYAIAPAYLPTTRVTLNENVTIGTADVQTQNSDIVREALSRYDEDKYYTGSTSFNDTYLNFSDVDLTNRSALAPYGDTFKCDQSRASYYSFANNAGLTQQTVATTGSNNTVVLNFQVEEPLMVSPFVFGKDAQNACGLFGIESMQYACQFGNLVKAITYNPANINLDNLNVVVEIANFGLKFQYLTPQVDEKIPRNSLYSYYETAVRTAQSVVVPKGTRTPVQAINLQLSGIPRRVYMLMREKNNDGTKPLRSLSLVDNSFSVRINNQPSLTNISNIRLYDMCRRNGYNLNYSQWSKFSGSVVCVDFGNGDISLHPEQAPAVSQKNEFEFSAQYDNLSTAADDGDFTAEFTVIVVYDGIFRMEDGNTSKQINPLTEQAILGTATNRNIHLDHTPDNVYGGSLCSGLARVKQGINLVSKLGGLADKAHETMCSGSGLRNANGGKMVSRSSLRNRY